MNDTLDLSAVFSAYLAPNDTRTKNFTYTIVTPKKKETGGSATGQWVDLPYIYSLAGSNLIAADTLFPAPFDLTSITGRTREIAHAKLQVKLFGGSDQLDAKEFIIKIDDIGVQFVDFVLKEGNPVSFGTPARLIPGTPPTLTIPTPYYGTNGYGLPQSDFWGYFARGYSGADSTRVLSNIFSIVGTSLVYSFFIDAIAVNDNRTAVPRAGEPTTGDLNKGHPISAQGSSTATPYAFYINKSANGPIVGETGHIDYFVTGTDPSDFRTLRLNVKTVAPAGIVALTPEQTEASAQAGSARRFRVDAIANVNAYYYAGLAVSEGPTRIYVAAENNNESLLVIDSTINTYNGSPTLELASLTAANSIKVGDDYVASTQVKLTAATAANAPAGTPISFKITPKSNFDTNGSIIDWNQVVQVTTKIYAE
jgi:hypothetical protein